MWSIVIVVAKVPAFNTSYGDSAPCTVFFTLVCLGIPASVIGTGFLFSVLVTVNSPNITLQGIIRACDREAYWF
jgi:hypothetical protein